MIYIAGQGHGGPASAMYTSKAPGGRVYPNITQDEAGLKKTVQAVVVSGRHFQPRRSDGAGSSHEGGELGFSLSHAFGAAFDNPDLIVTCIVSDGEAEVGPLATAWHSVRLNPRNFRVFGPDETLSNLLDAVFTVTNRQWEATRLANDEFLAPAGRVLDSMLSEHQCQRWLECYLLFNNYEAFIRIVDSMFSLRAKRLMVTAELPWRRKIASLNYLLASHVWQQDHNGFTYQDPGSSIT